MTINDDPASSMPDQGAPVVPAGLSLDIDIGDNCLGEGDWPRAIETAVSAALGAGLSGPLPSAELYVALVSNEQSQELNAQYRSKNYATNVLSFPATDPDELSASLKVSACGGPPLMLGDLIIADAVVAAEAKAQNKSCAAHLTHLVVHGVLHLLGYDHINDSDAEEMEAMERDVLEALGIDDPYETSEE